jgi:F-type H+-transporting ATPase subunit b
VLQINATLFFQVVNFIVLVWILNRILFRPFVRVVQDREERTEGARARGARLEGEAGRLREEYDTEVSRLSALGASEVDGLRQKGRTEGEGLVEEARQRSLEEVRRTRQDLASSTEQVSGELKDLSRRLSRQVAEKVLGRKIE